MGLPSTGDADSNVSKVAKRVRYHRTSQDRAERERERRGDGGEKGKEENQW